MKKIMLVLIAALYLWSCECEEVTPTLAENIDPFLITGSQDNRDGSFFIANFSLNKAVDTSTIESGTSIVIDGLSNINIGIGSFNSTFFIDISGGIQGCIQSNFLCTGTVSIIFKGDGSNPVRSASGQKLDGDKDGSDGGDAVFTFTF